jgi:hypothetical protein
MIQCKKCIRKLENLNYICATLKKLLYISILNHQLITRRYQKIKIKKYNLLNKELYFKELSNTCERFCIRIIFKCAQ